VNLHQGCAAVSAILASSIGKQPVSWRKNLKHYDLPLAAFGSSVGATTSCRMWGQRFHLESVSGSAQFT
ncbi:hypothetical protein, partial [Polaromonas sp. P5_E6]